MNTNKSPLCPCSLGLAIGITWGAGIALLGWLAGWCDWGTPFVHLLGSLYLGYAPTFLGGLYGGLWGFVDGWIAGAIIGWLYNFISQCACQRLKACIKKCSPCCNTETKKPSSKRKKK